VTETLLQFAGAAGATLLVLYLFGGLVMWVRFHAAGIPADQTVAVLPRELLVVVGLRTVVVEIVVFALVAAAGTAIASRRVALPPATGIVATAGFVAVLALAALLDVLLDKSMLGHRLTGGGVARVAGLAVAAVVVTGWFYGRWLNRRLGREEWPFQRALWLSMPMVVVSAATLGLAWEGAKGPIFPPVKIVRTGKAGLVEGFFVGETSSEILVGTGLCDEDDPRIQNLVAVPRDEVAAVVMSRSVRLTDPDRRRAAAASVGVDCPS